MTLPEQLSRDVPALRTAGVEPVAPLHYDRVVETALSLPVCLLATDSGTEGGAPPHRGVVPEPVRTAGRKAVR